VKRVGAKGDVGGFEERGLKSSFNCGKAYDSDLAAKEKCFYLTAYTLIKVIVAGKGWIGVGGRAFVGLRLLSVPFHEANSTCKAKISQLWCNPLKKKYT